MGAGNVILLSSMNLTGNETGGLPITRNPLILGSLFPSRKRWEREGEPLRVV